MATLLPTNLFARYTYPGAWINTFVAAGLIYLQYSKKENWTSPFHSYLPLTVIFLFANVFLAIVPFIPPQGDPDPDGYPFFVFPVVGVGVLFLGAFYWLVWLRIIPRFRGYKIVGERVVLEDGGEAVRYKRVPVVRG